MEERVLFCVGSVYQLLNSIVLRQVEKQATPADIILTDFTNWDLGLVMRLKSSRVFENVYSMEMNRLQNCFWELPLEERKKVVENPFNFFDHIPFDRLYTELFVPTDQLCWKMLYRYELINEVYPKIIIYDEGVRSYTRDIQKGDRVEYLNCEVYRSAQFSDAIEAYYLYQPDLFSIKDCTFKLRQLPLLSEKSEVKSLLLSLFGYESMPKEPYIYLEDFFFADSCVTNDFELFKELAQLVGRENIIVKRHPRDRYDRFSVKGYKTVSQSVIPWEIQLLANDLSSKVLISVSSTSILTPYIIFNADMHVISLEKMFIGDNPTHKDAAFSAFFAKLKAQINEKEVRFHTPGSFEELREVIRYIRLLQLN